MTARLCSIVCLLAVVAAAPIAQRDSSQGDASSQRDASSIRGRIVADGNDRPLRRALVTLTGVDRRVSPVLTDDEGRFEIQAPDSSASLTVTKAGYAATRVTLPPAARASRELVVRMPRGGVISGRVVDSNGDAAFGMKVVARQAGAAADPSRAFEAEANDLGYYRIAGLPAGRYTVSPAVTGPRVLTVTQNDRLVASMKEGRRLQDALPESSSPPRSADVRSGDETSDIDFVVAATDTFRALMPVAQKLPTVQTPPNGQPGVAIGPALPELGGARLLNVSGGGPPRSMNILVSGGGVVSGTVVDAAGEPLQDVVVRALGVRQENGRMVARAYGWERVTDDRGRYRLFGLVPGSYLIVASLNATEFTTDDAATGYAPLYFPGTIYVDGAQTVRVESGSEASGTDLTYVAAPTARLTGRVSTTDGEPFNGRVSLGVTQRSGAIAPEPRSVRTEADGSFELTDVAPGDYVLRAIGQPGMGTPPEFGSEFVTVSERNPPPVTISTSRGVTLEGRFVVDGMPDPPLRVFSLHASPSDLDRSPPEGRGPAGLAIHDDGRFYLTGLYGQMRLTAPSLPPGWYLKSVTIGGVDVTDTSHDFGFAETTVTDAEIVLSPSGAAIAGSLENLPGGRELSSKVIAFSTSRDGWFQGSRYIKQASPRPTGSFEVTGLPPGEYFLVAVDAGLLMDWRLPDSLESLAPRAERVTAREGVVSRVALRLIRR